MGKIVKHPWFEWKFEEEEDYYYETAYPRPVSEEEQSKNYECPRGHRFITNNPIIISVDGDHEYNSGPICGYCYVDWFKVNLNALEERVE